MMVKFVSTAMVVCAGLTLSATSASAADWWRPGTWFAPRPTYGYSTGYRGNLASCPGGVCRPTYGGGNCANGVCTPVNRAPTYAPQAPAYIPNYQPAPMPSTRNSNYRGMPARRPNYSPFYE